MLGRLPSTVTALELVGWVPTDLVDDEVQGFQVGLYCRVGQFAVGGQERLASDKVTRAPPVWLKSLHMLSERVERMASRLRAENHDLSVYSSSAV